MKHEQTAAVRPVTASCDTFFFRPPLGDNYRFGFKAAGDATQLQSLGAACGLAVAIVGSVQDCGPACAPGGIPLEDRKISSTRVRQALQKGDLQCVEQLLGRRHQLAAGLTGGASA